MSGRHQKNRPTPLQYRLAGGVVVGTVVIGSGVFGAAVAPPARSSQQSHSASAVPASAAAPAAAKTLTRALIKAPALAKGPVPSLARAPIPSLLGAFAPSAVKSPGVSVTPAAVIKLAEQQVGIAEDSAGGGTKFQTWFVGTPLAKHAAARDGGSAKGYENAAWCDMFVSWVGARLGFTSQMGTDAYVPDHAKWFADRHQWGATPKPGAVVFFSWDGGHRPDNAEHVGLVVKNDGGGDITTVEGNTGNAVRVRTRSTSSVVGYGYPAYSAR